MGMQELAATLVEAGYLRTPAIIDAFLSVDRRLFTLHPREAYQDHPLPLPGGQTISAPHMVAIMLELLQPGKKDIILEIGGGSGYAAAILGLLAREVWSLEVDPDLAAFARERLLQAGVQNVKVLARDGSRGLSGRRFTKILASCAFPFLPRELVRQLKDPGILVAPVGEPTILIRAVKEKGRVRQEHHGACAFVPLRARSVPEQ